MIMTSQFCDECEQISQWSLQNDINWSPSGHFIVNFEHAMQDSASLSGIHNLNRYW